MRDVIDAELHLCRERRCATLRAMIRLDVGSTSRVLAALGVLSCGADAAPQSRTAEATSAPRAALAPDDSPRAALSGGSSDGTTCEEARDAHPDEVGPGAARHDQPEPPDHQFSGPLSHGSYLEACSVPADTRIEVCAAIAEGKALGVTVATRPADVDKEKCIAGRVREISFPSHPRLRVVRASF